MPLLELGASGRSFASGVGRNGIELSRKPGDEVCEPPLPSTNLLQLWLTQYDRGELSTEEAEGTCHENLALAE